jgi:hypothetical protein
MELFSEYEKYVFKNIQTLDYYIWYRIDPLRPDCAQLIAAIKKRIDLHGDYVFDNNKCEWFMRVNSIQDFEKPDILKEKKYWAEKLKKIK